MRSQIPCLAAVAAFLFVAAGTAAPAYVDPPWIFGMHDEGGEYVAVGKGKLIWTVKTEALGHDRNNHTGPDYRSLTSAGHGVLARLNNGYNPVGTIPAPQYYDDFAIRCGNFVEAALGDCHIWIIGNEMNFDSEWPNGQEITPALYAQCFKKCRDNIKSRPGHANDWVIPGAVGTYGGLPCIQFFTDMLSQIVALGSTPDGFAIHCYTNGFNADLIFSEAKDANGIYVNFRMYRDFMNAIPANLRGLPAFITETDATEAWWNSNIHWVANACQEINDWNHSGHQVIRSVCLYRWCCDYWNIYNKPSLIGDWRDTMGNNYRWDNLLPIIAISAAKSLADGTGAAVSGVVTARFPVGGTQDRVYIQHPTARSGIAVATTTALNLGDEAQVQGTMTTSNGERVLTTASVTVTATGRPIPNASGVSNRSLGSGQFGLQPAVLDDSASSRYASGLNNVGTVVRAWGRTTYVDPSGAYFYMDDGSSIRDGSGRTGIRVGCSGLPVPPVSQHVVIGGISATTLVSGHPVRFLRPRSTDDLSYAAGLNYLSNPGFENGFTGGVGNNWTAFTYSGGISLADSTTTVHSGSHSQKVICATGADEGGVYQRFDTVVNLNYTVSLWVYAGSAPDSQPGGYLGIDPYGGTDPTSASVIWYQAGTKNAWTQISRAVQAKAARMTIYLDSWGATSYFDDASASLP